MPTPVVPATLGSIQPNLLSPSAVSAATSHPAGGKPKTKPKQGKASAQGATPVESSSGAKKKRGPGRPKKKAAEASVSAAETGVKGVADSLLMTYAKRVRSLKGGDDEVSLVWLFIVGWGSSDAAFETMMSGLLHSGVFIVPH